MPSRTTQSLDEGRITFTESGSVEMIDLVCGMDVDPDDKSTRRSDHDGTTYYFCSDACKTAFERAPVEFVASADRDIV